MSADDNNKSGSALPTIDQNATAFSHYAEHGFSLFLANRTKKIHFIRHAEGQHNEANAAYGDDTPVTYSTPGAWDYVDAYLTKRGIDQCVTARETLLNGVSPQLVVVSPFTRTLQTAHIMFSGQRIPFLVHDLCKERSGKYTCDKRRHKMEIIREFGPVYETTQDMIDFESFGYTSDVDTSWHEEREASEDVVSRGTHMMQWLATRPEKEIAVVTHSSWLKHLFRAFGDQIAQKDKKVLHRLAGNAEVRSISLAMHRGFYPEGVWEGDTFIPTHKSFRRYRYAPSMEEIGYLHSTLRDGDKTTEDDSKDE